MGLFMLHTFGVFFITRAAWRVFLLALLCAALFFAWRCFVHFFI
jgi:hypothetical protein